MTELRTDPRPTTIRRAGALTVAFAAALLCGLAAGCTGISRPAAHPVARPLQPTEQSAPAPIARHDRPQPVPPSGYFELPPAP